MSLAHQILAAAENGDLEAVHENGRFKLLIDRKPVIETQAYPIVGMLGGDKVVLRIDGAIVQTIDTDSTSDASELYDVLDDCFSYAREPFTFSELMEAFRRLRKLRVNIANIDAVRLVPRVRGISLYRRQEADLSDVEASTTLIDVEPDGQPEVGDQLHAMAAVDLASMQPRG